MNNILPPLSIMLLVSMYSAGAILSQEEKPEAAGPLREIPFAGLTELSFLKTGDPLVDWNSRRTWTSSDGRSLSAKILGVKGDQVALDTGNGKATMLRMDRL